MQEIQLHLPPDLVASDSPIFDALPSIQTRLTTEVHENPSRLIRINRHIQSRWDHPTKRFIPVDPYWEYDATAILIATAEEIVSKIHDLNLWISDIRVHTPSLILLVRNLDRFKAKIKTLANREFTSMARAGLTSTSNHSSARLEPADIDAALLDMQICQKILIVHGELQL